MACSNCLQQIVFKPFADTIVFQLSAIENLELSTTCRRIYHEAKRIASTRVLFNGRRLMICEVALLSRASVVQVALMLGYDGKYLLGMAARNILYGYNAVWHQIHKLEAAYMAWP